MDVAAVVHLLPKEDFDQHPGHFIECHAISGQHGESSQEPYFAGLCQIAGFRPRRFVMLTKVEYDNDGHKLAKGFCLNDDQQDRTGYEISSS